MTGIKLADLTLTRQIIARALYMPLLSVALATVCALAVTDLDKMQTVAAQRYGQDAVNTVAEWRNTITQAKDLSDSEKIVLINDFFNTRIRFMEDPQAWGEKDYWATPLEVMAFRKGDCEDFSIAKYTTLLLAGVDMSKLRITYVKAKEALALLSLKLGKPFLPHLRNLLNLRKIWKRGRRREETSRLRARARSTCSPTNPSTLL